MPEDEAQHHHSDESDSEVEIEEEEEEIPLIEVDATELTALSPEVISKQVRRLRISFWAAADWIRWNRPRLT